MSQSGTYYIPHGSRWPIVAAIGLFLFMVGFGNWLNGNDSLGQTVMGLGALTIIGMMVGWFGSVIHESMRGNFNGQVDVSFRMGMMWFIFSEVMFFGAFFGALFYTRMISIPTLGGEGAGALTNQFLWNGFAPAWPSNGPEHIGGAFSTMPPWGIPLLNTLLLLSSSVTITIAHHALRAGHRGRLLVFLGLTVLLGATFLRFQVHEYIEAVAWYWHFVDVVWLCLFLFVYVL